MNNTRESPMKFWLVTIGLFLLYCGWIVLLIFNPPGAVQEQTLSDRAPAWCEFHDMTFYQLGDGRFVGSAKVYQCIDNQSEVHTYVEN